MRRRLTIARRAYPRWRTNFFWLFDATARRRGSAISIRKASTNWRRCETAVAGSPQTVRDFIAAEIEATGANYFVPWLAFGDMTVEEALHSVDLFAREVMPAFR